MPDTATSLGILVGYFADTVLGDPKRAHPVALYGKAAAALERRMWADSRVWGAAHVFLAVGAPVALGRGLSVATRGSPCARFAVTALSTWTVLGGRGLAEEATVMSRLLGSEDIEAARARLGHLCGRSSGALDNAELSRATVESLAENTSDAVVAPLVWGSFAGIAGLLGYRAVNTLDAMIGHRSPSYARFGWAAARCDDVANLLPARLSALLTSVAAPVVGGSASRVLRVWKADGAAHPSPNAGVVEAAFAGALGLRLGGTSTYHGQREERGVLGDGRAPNSRDLDRVVRLCRAVGGLALAVTAVPATARRVIVSSGGRRRARSPVAFSDRA